MTPEAADQRIILSRHTLARYSEIIMAGIDPAPDTVALVHGEMEVLEAIAEEFPNKAPKLVALMKEWAAMYRHLKSKMH